MSAGTATPRHEASRPTRMPVELGYRALVLRLPRVSGRAGLRALIACLMLALLTVATALAALALGEYPLGLGEVVAALRGDPEAGFARIVVVQWRLPRAIAAVTLGAGLAVAGAVFQSLTRNPLASPDVIGFSTGAYTGVLLAIIVFSGTALQVAAGSLLGGLATAAAVYLLAFRRGVLGFRLIVVGIGIAAMLGSVNTYLLLTAELETAMSAAVWGAGTIQDITPEAVVGSGVVIGVLLLGIAALAPALRRLELGDDAAIALGTRAEPVRLGLMVLGVAITASVTAVAGPIAFVSLAAPQIARRLCRSPGVPLLPAAVCGALLLSAADLLAQHGLPRVLPVGVVTVVVGGSYLVWLIIHEVRRRGRR